jgi:hypothetical protein
VNIVKKNDRSINSLLKEFVGTNKIVKKNFAKIDIENIYRSKMGEVVSSYTESIYLTGEKLYINIISAPLRAELLKSKENLKAILNEELEEELIKEIYIR